jgi:hypothetical protein
MIVVDIWGGEGSGDHLARFLRPVDDALKSARTELAKGFLVNLRDEVAWGEFKEFDARRLQ